MDGEVLKMIIGFCRHFENEPEYIPPKAGDPERYIPTADDWEMQYLFISHDMLLQIIKGADFLNIPRLIDACCYRLSLMIQGRGVSEIRADFLNIPRLIDACCYRLSLMIQGRGVSEIRKIFMIENDFSPEEEEKMRREHIWYDCPLPEHPNFDA
uniref:Skp1-related protein n=1 Tax=Panagrolaimus sp. JU765 TaxID=591449 RepID=A0AC34QS56_9BILA